MLPREGATTFQRALALRQAPNVVVSTGDLATRISQWVTLDALRQPEQQPQPTPAELHTRPALDNAYEAPRVEVERTLAHIWQELLGVEEIGIHDNFFELGGHSLLGIQFIARLRDTLGVEISIHQLFDTPTIAGLCAEIERSNPSLRDDVAAIAEMLDLVEQLSDEEVARLLAADGADGSGAHG